ncbi:WAT1-related protein At5g07050-like [Aristolochia californica]|uniref:WAT1-related protein At5g07050-like n=1 Tax=Aristolochia californica TaxID=171875 RepID=UPI0035D9C75B
MKDCCLLSAMLFLQVCTAAMYLLTRVALTEGLSHYIYVSYRQIIAATILSPVAYFTERNRRPQLSLKNLWQIFFVALIGITLNQNLYYAGLSYVSTTFASTVTNLIPAITFIMAFFLRLEIVNLKSKRGWAKVIGTVACVGGAMIMTMIKGPALKSMKLQAIQENVISLVSSIKFTETPTSNWLLGAMLLFASALSWSVWMIFQVKVSRDYPAQMSLTALMCTMAAIQCTVVTLLFEKPSAWKVNWDLQLLACAYSGLFTSAIGYFIQVWSVKKKGPVFATAFSPLTTVLVAILEPFILRLYLHLGSLVGMLLVIGGLYAVLWGKATDETTIGSSYEVQSRLEAEEAGITEPLLVKDITAQLNNSLLTQGSRR